MAAADLDPPHGVNGPRRRLEQLGLVAPPEEFAPLPVAPARAIAGSYRTWPSYAHALAGAPRDPLGAHSADRAREASMTPDQLRGYRGPPATLGSSAAAGVRIIVWCAASISGRMPASSAADRRRPWLGR